MLLPSGNDAAVAMATHFGTKLLKKKEEYDEVNNNSHNSSVSESSKPLESKEETVMYKSETNVNEDLQYLFGPVSIE